MRPRTWAEIVGVDLDPSGSVILELLVVLLRALLILQTKLYVHEVIRLPASGSCSWTESCGRRKISAIAETRDLL